MYFPSHPPYPYSHPPAYPAPDRRTSAPSSGPAPQYRYGAALAHPSLSPFTSVDHGTPYARVGSVAPAIAANGAYALRRPVGTGHANPQTAADVHRAAEKLTSQRTHPSWYPSKPVPASHALTPLPPTHISLRTSSLPVTLPSGEGTPSAARRVRVVRVPAAPPSENGSSTAAVRKLVNGPERLSFVGRQPSPAVSVASTEMGSVVRQLPPSHTVTEGPVVPVETSGYPVLTPSPLGTGQLPIQAPSPLPQSTSSTPLPAPPPVPPLPLPAQPLPPMTAPSGYSYSYYSLPPFLSKPTGDLPFPITTATPSTRPASSEPSPEPHPPPAPFG
eukprot:RCo042161